MLLGRLAGECKTLGVAVVEADVAALRATPFGEAARRVLDALADRAITQAAPGLAAAVASGGALARGAAHAGADDAGGSANPAAALSREVGHGDAEAEDGFIDDDDGGHGEDILSDAAARKALEARGFLLPSAHAAAWHAEAARLGERLDQIGAQAAGV